MNKIKIFFIMLISIPLSFITMLLIVSIIGVFCEQKHPIIPSSNDKIVKVYSNDIKGLDSVFLYDISEAFIETDYDGWLIYDFHSRNNHTLGNYESDLTDTFPKIRNIIKNKFSDARDSYYDIWYYNKVVFFEKKSCLYNKRECPIILLYSKDINSVKKIFPKYIIYENVLPKDDYCWLYKFEQYWYICSPDYHVWFYQLQNME